MWTMDDVKEIKRMHEHLRALNAEFDREMRARGFDPAQLENVALPAHLAELYKQREQVKAELAELTGEEAGEEAGEKSDD
jgi:predicted GNAT superfamily acetyltransferase